MGFPKDTGPLRTFIEKNPAKFAKADSLKTEFDDCAKARVCELRAEIKAVVLELASHPDTWKAAVDTQPVKDAIKDGSKKLFGIGYGLVAFMILFSLLSAFNGIYDATRANKTLDRANIASDRALTASDKAIAEIAEKIKQLQDNATAQFVTLSDDLGKASQRAKDHAERKVVEVTNVASTAMFAIELQVDKAGALRDLSTEDVTKVKDVADAIKNPRGSDGNHSTPSGDQSHYGT